MKTFTRSPWAYWGDRIFIAVLLCGLGALFAIGTWMMVAQGRTDLGPMPIIGPVLGVVLFVIGIWAFFQPWPTRMEIDAKEVRVFFRPTKILTIARKNIVGAKTRAVPRGGSAFGIVYKDAKGKTRGVKLYGGWGLNEKKLNDILGTTPPPTPWF